MLLTVRHNIEVAHRLSLLDGKCENIHGHSMWVDLTIVGDHLNEAGIICDDAGVPYEFGLVKKEFRAHLDNVYDHHLLLNEDDMWAQQLGLPHDPRNNPASASLPGLQIFPGDPSTENIALWIGQWAARNFRADVHVKVQETAVNAVTIGVKYDIGS